MFLYSWGGPSGSVFVVMDELMAVGALVVVGVVVVLGVLGAQAFESQSGLGKI